jgi:hypothetical protein
METTKRKNLQEYVGEVGIMTNKQLVLSIYPEAFLVGGDSYGIFIPSPGYARVLSSKHIENSEAIAWKNAADNIKVEMLRKFES